MATLTQPPSPRPAPPARLAPERRRPRGRFPLTLTRGGAVLLGLTAFVFVATVSSGANLLYFLFGLMVGIPVLSALVSSWSLRRIHIRRELGGHIIAGEPAEVDYFISTSKRQWATMAMQFRELNRDLTHAPGGFVLHLPAGSTQEVRITSPLVARNRGLVMLEQIEISTTFPLGVLRRTRRLRVPQEMIVYPRIGVLNRHLALEYRESVESGAMTSNRRGGLDEFYGVREYRPGDNMRAIHWRSSARTGQMMIREMASNAPPQLIVVLNLRSWRQRGDTPEQLERAIELAATLVCYGFFENFAVALAVAGLSDNIPPAPRMGRDARALALRRLAVLDVNDVQQHAGIDFPNRVAGRAEWVVVTLHADDPLRDLLPPGGSVGAPGSSSHRTVLALDDPDARNWVHYLKPQDTLRILRERQGTPPPGGQSHG